MNDFKHDWKNTGINAVTFICIMILVVQVIVYNNYKNVIENEVNTLSNTITNYVNLQIEDTKNLIKTFNTPFDITMMSKSDVEDYIAPWVENIEGIDKVCILYEDNRYYMYSLNEVDTDYELIKDKSYYNRCKNNNDIIIEVDEENNKLIFTKPLFDSNYDFNGIVLMEYNLSVLENKIDEIGLYQCKLNIELKSNNDVTLYTNTNAEKTNEEDSNIIILGKEYSNNIEFVTSTKYNFEETAKTNENVNILKIISPSKFELQNYKNKVNNKISKSIKSTNNLFTINVSTTFKEGSNNFQTRQLLYVVIMMLIILWIAVRAIFVKDNFDRRKIYFFNVTVITIVFVTYIIAEMISLNKLYDQYFSIEAIAIENILDAKQDGSQNIGSLLASIIEKSSNIVNKYGTNIIKDGYSETIREYLVKFIMNFDTFKQISLFEGKEMFYSYPNTNSDVMLNKDILRKQILEVNNDKYYTAYNISNDNELTLVVEFEEYDYNEIFPNQTIIKKYTVQKENTVSNNMEIYNTFEKEQKLNEINSNIYITKEIDVNEIKGVIITKSSTTNEINIYYIDTPNVFSNIINVCGVTVVLIGFFTTGAIYFFRNRKISKEKIENVLNEDTRIFDQLVKKVNDDVTEISLSLNLENDDID